MDITFQIISRRNTSQVFFSFPNMLASSRVGFVTHDRAVSTTRFRVLDRRSHNGVARLRTDRSPSGYS